MLFQLILVIIVLLFYAIKISAILGLLRKESLGKLAWEAIWSSIGTYSLTLFRLELLIAFIAGLIVAGLSFLLVIMGLSKLAIVLVFVLYLILIKYALAYPLVVMENLGAVEALNNSWEMTQGHFGYVLGNFLFLGLCVASIHWMVASPFQVVNSSHGWFWWLGQFAAGPVDSMWTLQAWCMYWRIKKVEDELRSAEEAAAS